MPLTQIDSVTLDENAKREVDNNMRQAEKDEGVYKKRLAKQRREKMKEYNHLPSSALNVIEPSDDVAEISRLNLLATHRIVSHRFSQEKRVRPEFDHRKVEPRNFAILLLQRLEPKVNQLKVEYQQTQRLGLMQEQFVAIIMRYLIAIQEEGFTDDIMMDGKYSNQWYFAGSSNTKIALEVLFQAIDFQDSGRLKWEPFVSYCIDASMKGTTGVDYDSFVMSYEPCFAEEGQQYSGVRKLRYIPELAKLLCCERSTLKIVDPVDWKPLRAMYNVGGILLDAEYIPERNMFVTSSSDLMLNLFDPEYPSRPVSVHVEYSQVACRWSQRWKRLFTGCRQGMITVWDVRAKGYESRWNPPFKLNVFEAHTEAITGLLFHPLDGSILTCSLDSSIVIREPQAGEVIQRFTGHQAGVLSMTYSLEYNFLISGGVETCPLLWVISNSTKDRPFTLRDPDAPHKAPIAYVEALAGTAQVASLDLNGLLKIWDVRTFGCMHTIHCKPRERNRALKNEQWFSCTYVPSQKQLAVNSSMQLYIFEYSCALNGLDAPADSHPVSHVYYAAAAKVFLTAAGCNLRVWNANTGELHSKLDDITVSEITALCMDPHERKFFLGTQKGTLQSHTLSNGGLVFNYGALFKNEVTGLAYMSWERKCLIACSCDGTVQIFYDATKSSQHSNVLVNRAPIVARCCAYSSTSSLCGIGDANNVIYLWQISGGSMDSQFKIAAKLNLKEDSQRYGLIESTEPLLGIKDPLEAEVQAIHFLSGYPAIVATDSRGTVFVYNMQPPYVLLAIWLNYSANPEKPAEPSAAGAVGFLQDECCIFLGDECGHIRSYLLNTVLSFCVPSPRTAESPKPPDPRTVSVPLVNGWQAHTDGIRSMCIIQSIKVIVTGSYDHRVTIHTYDGIFQGCLDQNGFSFSTYTLKIPTIARVDMSDENDALMHEAQVSHSPSASPRSMPSPAYCSSAHKSQSDNIVGVSHCDPLHSISVSVSPSAGDMMDRHQDTPQYSPSYAESDAGLETRVILGGPAKPHAFFHPPRKSEPHIPSKLCTTKQPEHRAGTAPGRQRVRGDKKDILAEERKTQSFTHGPRAGKQEPIQDEDSLSHSSMSCIELPKIQKRALDKDSIPITIPEPYDAEAQQRVLDSFLSWQFYGEPESPHSHSSLQTASKASDKPAVHEVSNRTESMRKPVAYMPSKLISLPSLASTFAPNQSLSLAMLSKAEGSPTKSKNSRAPTPPAPLIDPGSLLQQRQLFPDRSQPSTLSRKTSQASLKPKKLAGVKAPCPAKMHTATESSRPKHTNYSAPFTKFWVNVRSDHVRGVEDEGWATHHAHSHPVDGPVRWVPVGPAEPSGHQPEPETVLYPDNSAIIPRIITAHP